jgi:hypothetical protein
VPAWYGASTCPSSESGRLAPSKLLANKSVLVVLDDAWNIKDVRSLDMVGPNGALVATTRNEGLVRRLGIKEIGLSMLEFNHAAGGVAVRSPR